MRHKFPSPNSRARAMILEHDDMSLLHHLDEFEGLGLDCTPAWMLSDALEVLENERIDIAVLAVYHRPGETSFLLADRVQKKGIPIIFMAETIAERDMVPLRFREWPVIRLPVGNAAMRLALKKTLKGRAIFDPSGPAWIIARHVN